MTKSKDKSTTTIVIVVVIVLALVIGAVVYAKSRVAIVKAQNTDKDIELAKIQANKENRGQYFEAENKRTEAVSGILNKAVDNVGNVANSAVGLVGDIMKDEEETGLGLETEESGLDTNSGLETAEALTGGAKKAKKSKKAKKAKKSSK